jgi:hypothetical protein
VARLKICPSTSFFKAIIPILLNYNTPILPILPSPTSDLKTRSKKKVWTVKFFKVKNGTCSDTLEVRFFGKF